MNSSKSDLKILEEDLNKNPRDLKTILSLGKLLGANKNHEKAEIIFHKGTKIYPENDTLKYNYAISLLENKKNHKGAIILRKLLSKYPDNNAILLSYANSLYKLEKYKLSLKYYFQFYSKDNLNIDVLTNIGIVLIALQNYSEALSFLINAFNLKDKSSLISRNIAFCYKNLNLTDDSIFYYLKSIELDKTYIGSYIALGSIYLDKNENNLAHDTFEKASIVANNILQHNELNKIDEILLNDIGTLYSIIGDFSKAEKSLKILNERFSSSPTIKMLLSEILLSQGNFEEGWHYYESRFDYYSNEKKIINFKNFSKPLWNPNLGNETILIWGEQGLGDQILYSTVLRDFIINFKKVYLMVDRRLINFLSSFNYGIKILGFDDALNEQFFDYHIPLGSIAKYCRKNINDFKPSNQKSTYELTWKEISKQRKFKCAISWKSINSFKSKYKSLKLKDLKNILVNPKIDFYNIQYTDETSELNELNKDFKISLKNPDGLDTYNDIDNLIKFINSCDFVITTSNTNAHLSGILKKQTFLLLPKIYGTWWYWNNEYENKNIWYPSVKVFSQKRIGDWASAVDVLNEHIQKVIFND